MSFVEPPAESGFARPKAKKNKCRRLVAHPPTRIDYLRCAVLMRSPLCRGDHGTPSLWPEAALMEVAAGPRPAPVSTT